MGVDSLLQVLCGYRLLMLDTMIFSYQLTDHPLYAPLTTMVLKTVESRGITGLSTTVTLAELLTVPARANDRRWVGKFTTPDLVLLEAYL